MATIVVIGAFTPAARSCAPRPAEPPRSLREGVYEEKGFIKSISILEGGLDDTTLGAIYSAIRNDGII